MQLSSIISLQLKMQVNVSEERDQEVLPSTGITFYCSPLMRRHRMVIAGAAK